MTQIRHIIHSFSFFYLLRKIDSLEKQNEIDIYYIHFLINAFQLIDFLRVTRKRVFVHCHGFDITWNLKRYQYPDIDYHTADYPSSDDNQPEIIISIANSNHLLFLKAKQFESPIL